MGLDMYLEKMPRYKNVTARMVSIMESYFNLEEAKIENPKYIDCTLEKWCGADETELPDRDILEYFKQFYKVRYFPWDIEHSYGHKMIIERVGYWRKANQIHNWFVNRVQDGIDDCEYHHECTKEILEELLATCKKVLESCTLVNGKINNGFECTKNGLREILEDGQVIIDSSVAEELLPSRSGFFFCCYDYDEYYVDDLLHTIDIIQHVLDETDFETESIFYVSSW